MKKILLVVILSILVIATLLFANNKNGRLISPAFIQVSRQSPAPTPLSTPNAPKTFKFDSSTDLRLELEKVNPQVLDSDF